MNPFSGFENENITRTLSPLLNSTQVYLNPDSTVTFALQSQERITFQFTALKDVEYSISLYDTTSNHNYKMYLANSDSVIHTQQYTNNANVSHFGWTCSLADTYYVSIKNVSSKSTNSTITISYDRFEPNNDRTTATLITTDGKQYRSLLPSPDVDWLKFNAKAGSLYKIKVKGLYNSVFTLDTINAPLILQNRNFNSDGNLEITQKCSKNIIYYCKLNQINQTSWQTNPYTFSIHQIANDQFEPDDSYISSTAIPVDGTVQKHIILNGDTDWLKFDSKRGMSYKIAVQGTFAIHLYSPNGFTRILTVPAGQEVKWTSLTDSTYYVNIYDYNSHAYSDTTIRYYSVSVKEYYNDQYEPDNSLLSAKEVIVNGDIQIHSLNPGDEDLTKFNAKKGVVYQFSTGKGISITVLSADSQSLNSYIYSDYYTDRTNVAWPCIADGFYYVKTSINFSTSNLNVIDSNPISVTTLSNENNSLSTINQVAVNYTPRDIDTLINVSQSEQKWLAISATAGTTYYIKSTGILPRFTMLFDSNLQNGLMVNKSSGSFGLLWDCKISGKYYLKVFHLANYLNTITLLLSSFPTDSYQSGSTNESAKFIQTDGIPQSRVILNESEKSDILKFTGKADSVYTIELVGNVFLNMGIAGQNGAPLTFLYQSALIMKIACTKDDIYTLYVNKNWTKNAIIRYTISVKSGN
jgi:hypothetical protein